MKPQMTIAEALEFADEWSRGMTFYEGSQGWRVVCLLLAEEVRRLAQVEAEHEALKKAISDAEPVAWIRGSGMTMLKLENGGVATVFASDGMSNYSTPLYTLEGIRTKP